MMPSGTSPDNEIYAHSGPANGVNGRHARHAAEGLRAYLRDRRTG